METIILVPGGGGSKLKLRSQEIWPPTLTEMFNGYQRITELQDSHVKATTVIDLYPPLPCYEVYKPLQDDLNTIAKHFTPAARRVDFAYDWRKDIAWSASQLASKIASCVSGGSNSITLEQNPNDLNRKGFPLGANSDSHCVLDKEASTHGQAFVGGFADQSCPGC